MSKPHFKYWARHLSHHISVPASGLYDNLATSARRYPGKTAIDFYGRHLSYAEMYRRAECLAGHLRTACGVRRGDRVIVDMQNSPAFVVAYYAILRADAIVVPVNPMNLTEELAWIVEDSGARVACIAQELWPQFEPLRADGRLEALVVAHYAADLPAQTDLPVPAAVSAPAVDIAVAGVATLAQALAATPLADAPAAAGEDIAVLAYTSGTTGRPKACLLSHRALQAGVASLGAWNSWTVDSVALATPPFFHVTGMEAAMNLPLFAGATVVLLPRWDRLAAAMLIERNRVTHWTNVPTMVTDLLALPDLGRYDFSSLYYIGGGGAAMPEAVATRLHELTGLEYQEGWGLTEVAGGIHLNPVGHAHRQCLGIPFFDVDTRIVDTGTGIELGPGEQGEIVTRCPSLFSGYWNNPDATRAAFIELDGLSFLRTGDIGYVDADGFFYLADRLKRMINASGYKVWPAEVESILYRHPAIHEACVVGVRDAHRGETVKAYVVLRDGLDRPPSPDEIVDWSRAHMAAYKIPRIVEFVDALPRSGTGKILWRVLQEQEVVQ